MPCYCPLKGYRSKNLSEKGRRPIVFSLSEAYTDLPVKIPCGQCIGCRLEKSRQWAIRCLHEASLYPDNCFLTLTYDENNLPPKGEVVLRHFQLFMKRLRKQYGNNIRYYHCGEYGAKLGRPHYHAIIFNHDFKDKVLLTIKNSHSLYTSKALEQLWPFGYSSIGDVTFQSAAYVARYILKKITGPQAKEHYQTIDKTTGQITYRKPEYTTMSRRPGIGKGWLEKYKTDVYPFDLIVVNGIKMKPPKFYDLQHEIDNPKEYKEIRIKRKQQGARQAPNNTPERLAIREEIRERKLEKLPRNLDKGD